LPGNDDRRLRPKVAGPRRAPSPTASQPAAGGEPVDGAPGWRVTRRVGSAVEDTAGAAGPLGAFARSPRRVGAPGRRSRGISLLALAAAAVVVVFVLGLAALDAQRLDLDSSSGDQPALNPDLAPAGAGVTGGYGRGPDEALTGRPG
jgi:hypothetical protein